MRALVYGVQPEPVPEPPGGNPLLEALARTPMRLLEVDEPELPRPDWVIIRPRLTGICGSDSKQVFMDWGSGNVDTDNPMIDFASFPQVLGHEVVADVVEVGREAQGLSVGDRVVLNPWLSCAPRGISPVCPPCEIGDLSLCWHFTDGPLAPGIHIGTSKDLPGGYANLMPAHHSMLFAVPDVDARRDRGVRRPVRGVAALDHSTPTGARRSRRSCTARARSAAARWRSCARSTPTSRSVWSRGSTPSAARREARRPRVFQHEPAKQLIEEIADWSGGVLRGDHDLPMAYPGGVDVVYDNARTPESLEVARRAQGARHAREGRRPRTHRLGVDPAVLQGAVVGRLERVWVRGDRRRAQARHPALPRSREQRPRRHRPDAHAHVPARRRGATRSACSRRRPTPARSRSRSTSAREQLRLERATRPAHRRVVGHRRRARARAARAGAVVGMCAASHRAARRRARRLPRVGARVRRLDGRPRRPRRSRRVRGHRHRRARWDRRAGTQRRVCRTITPRG